MSLFIAVAIVTSILAVLTAIISIKVYIDASKLQKKLEAELKGQDKYDTLGGK